MYNYQLKYNTEPRRGEQPDYGGGPKPKPKPKPGRKGSSGIIWEE
jgi:hypothetical protein